MATVSSLSASQLSNLTATSAIGSWAEAVEQESLERHETMKDGIKTVTDYVDEDSGRYKVVTTFKVVTKRVPRQIAERKKLRKFGACIDDSLGPQVSTTYRAEEVFMQFTRNRAGEQQLDVGDEGRGARDRGTRMHCRHCKSDEHWAVHCPYKEMYANKEDEDEGGPGAPEADQKKDAERKTQAGKYVAPGMRGDARPMQAMLNDRRDENTVRVTNLPEDVDEVEFRELFGTVGRILRVYIARDKQGQRTKGFAFVTYDRRDQAEAAINQLSGTRLDHLVLKVEWTRQNN